jgi:hypothetical protein
MNIVLIIMLIFSKLAEVMYSAIIVAIQYSLAQRQSKKTIMVQRKMRKTGIDRASIGSSNGGAS